MDTTSAVYLPGERKPGNSVPTAAPAVVPGAGGEASAASSTVPPAESGTQAAGEGTSPGIVNQDTGSAVEAAGSNPLEQLENLASNLAQSLVQEASHAAAQAIAHNEAASSAQVQEEVPSVQPLSLDQFSDLAQDESIIQALIEAQNLEQGGEIQQQTHQIILQEEGPGQMAQQPGARQVLPAHVQVVQPVRQPGMQAQPQVRVMQPQGISRPQGQPQQVTVMQQQVRMVPPGQQQQQQQQQQRFQSQQVINVQQAPGFQQQFKPVDFQFQVQPGGQGGAVQVRPAQVVSQQQVVTVQQQTTVHKKGPAPQPPPKPTSPIKIQAPVTPNVQEIAYHSPKIQPTVPFQQPAAVQQPVAVQQPMAVQQQPVVVQESMVQPVARQQAQQPPAMQQPAVQQPAVQPVAVQQVQQQQPIVIQQQQQPQQPVAPQATAVVQAAEPAQPPAAAPSGAVSTKRPLAVQPVIKDTETLIAEGVNEQTKPRQFYQETVIDSRTSASLKMAPCILTDLFKHMTPEGKKHLSYFLFLCFGATFLSSATELPATWMVGCVYLVSNIMFYALDM